MEDKNIITPASAPVINNNLNKLENHIDEPIKKCVVGMALLGFKPMMSCCGFSYKEEKVPKKHLKKAYIYLDYQDLMKKNMGTNLMKLAEMSHWKINILGDKFVDFYANTWEKGHPWEDYNCPHFHETFVLGINSLEKTLESLKDYLADKAVIEDGNKFYKETVSKYWQYEPTESWEVSKEMFLQL